LIVIGSSMVLDPNKVARTDVSIIPRDVTSLLCWCLHLDLWRLLVLRLSIFILSCWMFDAGNCTGLQVDWLFHDNHYCSFAAIPGALDPTNSTIKCATFLENSHTLLRRITVDRP
jgi:hypothetical protein